MTQLFLSLAVFVLDVVVLCLVIVRIMDLKKNIDDINKVSEALDKLVSPVCTGPSEEEREKI